MDKGNDRACPATAYPECLERLARIETKLDGYAAGCSDKENRLRSLERERWTWRGGLAAVIALFLK